jgi:pyridoxal phosphate enzyme (YggS family)
VQVRRLVLDDKGEQFSEIHYNPPDGAAKCFSSLVQRIMAGIADNLQAVRARIGRHPGVTLLAVSKGQSLERIKEAVAAGQKAFGENYVQEAVQKMEALPPSFAPLEWHLIGPLQSNKTRVVAERFDWVQTIASEKIARRLAQQRPAHLAPLNVLIQVNVSGETTKSGVALDELQVLARAVKAMPRLRLRGLMAIPEPGADRSRFHEVKSAFDSLKSELGFDTLSMGMSGDLDVALAEGATLVRIGTAIFGERKKEENAA